MLHGDDMKRRMFVGLITAGLAALKTSARISPQEEFSCVVTGRVVDIQGRPAAVSLYLTSVDFWDKNPPIEGYSDSEGQFALKGLPSTRYLLHVNLISPDDRKEPYYYPGVTDQEKAAVISLASGFQVNVADFRLPPQVQMQKMEGQVNWPDGRAATDAEVMFSTLDQPISYRWPSKAVKNMGQGRFVIYGFKGTTYWLGASEGEAHTVARKIILDADISGIELTLQRKG